MTPAPPPPEATPQAGKTEKTRCWKCHGDGQDYTDPGSPCPACDGTGKPAPPATSPDKQTERCETCQQEVVVWTTGRIAHTFDATGSVVHVLIDAPPATSPEKQTERYATGRCKSCGHFHIVDGYCPVSGCNCPDGTGLKPATSSAGEHECTESCDHPEWWHIQEAAARPLRAALKKAEEAANFWMNLYGTVKDYDEWKARADAAKARVKTLEAALREIRDYKGSASKWTSEIARRALKETR